jgi:hypothetical protein
MNMIADCLLKAENYAVAAQTAGHDQQRGFIRLAAIWRNRALRMTLVRRAAMCAQLGSSIELDAFDAA